MADLLRISILGAMPGGEEWTVNPVYSIGGDFGTPVTPAQAATIATAINAVAIPTAILQMMTNSTAFVGVRVEARSLLGVLESQGEAVKAVPVVGSTTTPHPYQTSLVSSLRSTAVGARGRGRLYWPATGVTLGVTNLRPTTANVVSHLSGVKTYLSGIQAAIDVTLDGVALAVWSRATPALFTVNAINMGDVCDVQRRRRDQLVENYSTTSYP